MIDKIKTIVSWLQLFFNRIPNIENNTIIDNSNLKDRIFNKPRKYNDLYSIVQNRTTISNESSREKIINNASVFIENVKDFNYEDIILNYGLDEQTFCLFAINDGNSSSEKKILRIETYVFKEGGHEEIIDFFDIEFKLLGGEIKNIFEDKLGKRLKDTFKLNQDYSKLIYKISFNSIEENLAILYYNREENSFFLGGIGAAGQTEKINLLELNVDDYRGRYVFNSLNFKVDKNGTREIDIFILPSKSCRIDYHIEYYYNEKKLKNCDKCNETILVKVPQFKLESRWPIQPMGRIFKFLIENKIKNYKKGENKFIDDQIGYSYEEFKKQLEIHVKAE